MKLGRMFPFFLAFCLFCNCAFAESFSRKIRKIDVVIEGVEPAEYSKKNIVKGLATREGDYFSHAVFDDDIKHLADNYYKVDSSIAVNDDDSLDVKINMLLYPKVRNIFWKGNEYYSVRALKKILDIRGGQTFSRDNFYKKLEKVKQHYIKGGFFESNIDYKLTLSSDKKEIDLLVDISEGLCGKIKRVSWVGASKKDIGYIKDFIRTKSYNVFLSWLNGQGFLNSAILDMDKAQILNYFQNEGYCDVTLETNITRVKESRFIELEFKVNKGDLYHFGNIAISGCKKFKEDALKEALIAIKGNVFSIEDIHDAIKQIKNRYASIGFVDAKVEPRITPSGVDSKTFDVDFNIEEGIASNVGLIHIRGTRHTKPNVILKKIFLRPGQLLNGNLVEASANYLRAFGLFDSVNVSLAPKRDVASLAKPVSLKAPPKKDSKVEKENVSVEDDKAPKKDFKASSTTEGKAETKKEVDSKEEDRLPLPSKSSDENTEESSKKKPKSADSPKAVALAVAEKKDLKEVKTFEPNSQFRDIYVDIEEGRTFTLNTGITFTQSQKALGTISLTERNFNVFGLGRALSTGAFHHLRGGGEHLRMSLNAGAAQRVFDASWTDPSFLDSLWSLTLSGGYNLSNTQNKTLNVAVSHGGIGTQYSLNRYSSIGMSYRIMGISTKFRFGESLFTDVTGFNAQAANAFVNGTDLDIYKVINKDSLETTVRDRLVQNIRMQNPGVTDVDAELNRQINEINTAAVQRSNNAAILRATLFRVRTKEATSGIVSFPSVNFNYNSLNRLIKPQKGIKSTTTLGYAGLGGNFDFWKFETMNFAYLPLWEKGSVVFRCSFGSIFGHDAQKGSLASSSEPSVDVQALEGEQTSANAPLLADPVYLRNLLRSERDNAERATSIPLSERFYSGGETTVRGYAPSRIGPINSQDGEPAGGFSYGLLSLEYRQEIFPQLDLFYFIDSSFVSQYSIPEAADLKLWRSAKSAAEDGDAFRRRGFKSSMGVGLYLYMPGTGPMAIGYGKVLNPAKNDDDVGIFFSMGVNF